MLQNRMHANKKENNPAATHKKEEEEEATTITKNKTMGITIYITEE